MKRTIGIVILTLISLLMFVYAFMQKLEADTQAVKAVEAQMEADMQRSLAMENEKRAIELHNELLKCQNEKKQ